jgi:multiple sugar transport system permease protein
MAAKNVVLRKGYLNKALNPKKFIGLVISYGLTILGAIITALPFMWMLLSAFKMPGDIISIPIRWLPSKWVLDNFVTPWQMMPFGRFYLNSIFVAVGQTTGVLITSTLAAYGFSRINFWGRNVLFIIYLGTIMIPGWVTLIPVYNIMTTLGWLNTYQGLIVPGMTSAFGTFLLRQFFMSVPLELEDAAFIDGASRLQSLVTVVIPLATPALLTVGLMTFMGSWNNLTWPLIIAQDVNMQTLPLGLTRLALQTGWIRIEWGPIMAATLMSILPIIVLYMFLQSYFIRGVSITGIK